MTFLTLLAAAALQPSTPADFRSRLPEDEVIYFLLPDRFDNGDPKNDRGGLKGDRLKTGFDPASKGFYNGGDLKGLTRRLDYLQGLGVTAIWFAPIFKNKPVQGPKGQESAGYHGYWVTDFTSVDPHFGTNAEFKAFVDAAHARGMKVYMDIITNHTADVIKFAECEAAKACPYRSIADYPYQRRGGPGGAAINPGFTGETDRSPENFARLTDPNYAYTISTPKAELKTKVPAWLNDPLLYHNRGDSTFTGESSTMGDFVGLDDLMTENPKVVAGFIDVYGSWIDRFGIDGFRIDTARHVNPEFWQQFAPAMKARAAARGIPNFHIFGEVYDDSGEPGRLAQHTVRDQLPAVLDFAFFATTVKAVARNQPTELFRGLLSQDVLYAKGDATARQLPTFLGNHDAGRFASYVRSENPKASPEELLQRVMLGNVLLFTWRGVPTVYYGDEQGIVGRGGDQDSRQTLFPSKVATYNDDPLLGTDRTTAVENFRTDHPLYRMVAELSAIRRGSEALRRGDARILATEDKPGLLAFSRTSASDRVIVAVNTSTEAITRNIAVPTDVSSLARLSGACPAAVIAPGTIRVTLPAFGHAICRAAN
ncbi:alpha-amylase [Sphingomonas astaxanthinifaciens DSM 22298]|uniref:Alpha-amylase n=1 Tax=Sphingomonas astaxanthinifaciens DSM 22298 TaxID=1123267 RepID=A0ABQ5ZBM2_9SPHN|nr:alpha-amylase family glycosyl hydrolase [Sphingomonas astaxanthinifaciens]GLR48189.1 alpha-amylase [Sphingomonas astaxanthinifaciens DSM 22298]